MLDLGHYAHQRLFTTHCSPLRSRLMLLLHADSFLNISRTALYFISGWLWGDKPSWLVRDNPQPVLYCCYNTALSPSLLYWNNKDIKAFPLNKRLCYDVFTEWNALHVLVRNVFWKEKNFWRGFHRICVAQSWTQPAAAYEHRKLNCSVHFHSATQGITDVSRNRMLLMLHCYH